MSATATAEHDWLKINKKPIVCHICGTSPDSNVPCTDDAALRRDIIAAHGSGRTSGHTARVSANRPMGSAPHNETEPSGSTAAQKTALTHRAGPTHISGNNSQSLKKAVAIIGALALYAVFAYMICAVMK